MRNRMSSGARLPTGEDFKDEAIDHAKQLSTCRLINRSTDGLIGSSYD
jgi:hypothetical protein